MEHREWRRWPKPVDRDLREGELIRLKVDNPNSPPPGWQDGYVYGIFDGGFGGSLALMGRAIFVKNESWFEADTLAGEGSYTRWNRGEHIEVRKG